MVDPKYYAQLAKVMLQGDIKQATKYLSPRLVITATRRTFRGKILKRENVEIIFKAGKPNYAERDFIQRCKQAGEPFPVKKIQVKYAP